MSSTIRVFARCRPESRREIEDQREFIVKTNTSRGEVSITCHETSKTFAFDEVFDSKASQKSLYDRVAFPIVDSVLKGNNGTILAYGQTGTGKTHTMQGIIDSEELRGITPRAFEQIFNRIESNPDKKQFLVRVSFFEIYNDEEIYDLLSKDQKSPVSIKDLLSVPVKNVADLSQKLETGNRNRRPGLTQMGQICSRSHSIFSITIESYENDHIKMGTLNLVDFAGSETRNRINTMNMNRSLANLGNVIYALTSAKSMHIPYKDSKLTRFLQDSLGGNGRTVLIANIGPVDYNFEETLHTLKFAKRVKTIKNQLRVNDDPPGSFLREFQEYIKKIKIQLKDKEEIIDSAEREMKNFPDIDRARLLGDLSAYQEHEKISRRLKKLENYILQGSEAREYAYKQQEEIEHIRKELEEKKLKELQLHAQIPEEQRKWRIPLTTQEEINEKSREIVKLSSKLEKAKAERQELQDDFSEEKASYLKQISFLNSQLKLKDLVINYFLPQDVVAKTEAKTTWNEQEEDWILPRILLSQDGLMKPQSSEKGKEMDKSYTPKRVGFDKKRIEESPNREEEKTTDDF